MMEPWIAILLAGGAVVTADLAITVLRKRARREPVSPRPLPIIETAVEQGEGVAGDGK